MAQVVVRAEGLKELRSALRDVDKALPREIRKALNEGARVVVNEARPTLPVRTGRLAASLRASSTAREGRVTMGRANVPYAGWIEFGGVIRHAGHGHVNDHLIRRPFVAAGRYVFPAAVRRRDQVIEACDRAVDDLIVRAGLGG